RVGRSGHARGPRQQERDVSEGRAGLAAERPARRRPREDRDGGDDPPGLRGRRLDRNSVCPMSARTLDVGTDRAGSRLAGCEIRKGVGAGGMGEVYRGRDLRLGRDVALKVLPQESASDPARVRRFEREARAASALNHPNIVTVYEVGSADAVSYIAMELVE